MHATKARSIAALVTIDVAKDTMETMGLCQVLCDVGSEIKFEGATSKTGSNGAVGRPFVPIAPAVKLLETFAVISVPLRGLMPWPERFNGFSCPV